MRTLEGHSAPVTRVEFSDDGTQVISASVGGRYSQADAVNDAVRASNLLSGNFEAACLAPQCWQLRRKKVTKRATVSFEPATFR